jgi:hypothetical protein
MFVAPDRMAGGEVDLQKLDGIRLAIEGISGQNLLGHFTRATLT